MIYIFHRADGFYPITFGSDADAIAYAELNPGNIKVTDSENREVFNRASAGGTGGVVDHGI